ncbi:hypothetical protein EO95_01200 [Methanosarcina sp. 1.H.T.1A.1]|uniref:hypothetical protein n=1 Tax=Methanosarcina sp. 1.H.T.1A.1 TaxID=1483602 RepID=UPI00062221E6|nr:hypothetical protein [Methanosarcina sp. 1.H.T.1A.1]KKI00310.1 hypothetical protein EO95_01200 [Methanosarcina sp. 1.H.T.1A.1]
MMRLFVFFGVLFALFGLYLTQYINQYREAYGLWVQEIVYKKDTRTTGIKKSELFSKIESLAKELCQLADAISFLFTILCFTFLITASATILNLRLINSSTQNSSVPNETACAAILRLLNISTQNDCECMMLILSLILSIILFGSLPRILRYANINIINPSKTSKIDEKLFDVWYKHRCFEHKDDPFSLKLQPRRLYEILARKYENEEKINGKDIEIPKNIKNKMEKEGLFKKKNFNP